MKMSVSKCPVLHCTDPALCCRYGRGQLNFPLPDFSKVEPRVRFPKAEESGYKPPKGRVAPQKSFAAGEAPLVFKSPAEIVREVLLSSTEGPAPPRPNAKVPEEFKSPQQATELVHQLQVSESNLHVHTALCFTVSTQVGGSPGTQK